MSGPFGADVSPEGLRYPEGVRYRLAWSGIGRLIEGDPHANTTQVFPEGGEYGDPSSPVAPQDDTRRVGARRQHALGQGMRDACTTTSDLVVHAS